MGFRSLFKVRKPGNGDAVQKAFEKKAKAKISIAGPINNSQNSSGKKGVK